VTGRYEAFDRTRWATLRESTPLTLTDADVDELRGINERLDLDEVVNVYLPLSRLLNLHIAATQGLNSVTDTFLGSARDSVPYVIGVAGSVAVGKSTTARVLRRLLSNWPDHPRVDLLTTDGFLHPNAVLESRNLMSRKGFPESYDTAALIECLQRIKSGQPAQAPVYSHLSYDIVEEQTQNIDRPDVLIVEGLNVLQSGRGSSALFVSDFFDFSIYVDAEEEQIRTWYVERFQTLRESVFQNPESYFRNYAELNDDEAAETAIGIWNEINAPNLRQNIEPTRVRADLILTKGAEHAIERIELRKG
jgi:type I pantothenate kinase